MPVANVPTTRLSAVDVRVDAQRPACPSRRGGRTRRADAGFAPRRCGEPASNSPCAPVGGRGALRDSRERLLPSTTVDGSSAHWSSIRFVSGRIGGFPFAFLPLEGLKRYDPHRGGHARRSKSAAMPISSLWRIDSDRKASAAALRSRRRRSGRERRRSDWGRVGPIVGSCAHSRGARASARFLECATTGWHALSPSIRRANTPPEHHQQGVNDADSTT
jgi:hypothetical protein